MLNFKKCLLIGLLIVSTVIAQEETIHESIAAAAAAAKDAQPESELPSDIKNEEIEDVEVEKANIQEEVDAPPQDSNVPDPTGKSGKLVDGVDMEPSHADALPPDDGREKSGRYFDENNYDSLTSEFAPNNEGHKVNGIPYQVPAERLKELRKEKMYWFWDKGGDSENIGDFQRVIQSSTPTVHKNLNFQLPFFGFRYNYTRVSLNGYLEFSDPPQTYASYPLVFPNKDWPKKNDPAFIGIFHSKCRIGSIRTEEVDRRKPGVYFRMERDLMGRTDKFGSEVRERLMWDIREGVIGAEAFVPKHAIIVTWKNVSFTGGISQAMYTTNSFQLVLATDEVFTYAIFNYRDLQWSSHTEAGGDTTKGEGGIPAYVGFNAGNGTRAYEYKPYSQESVLRDLVHRGYANNIAGRHIFRIDENILHGTCNKDIDSANLPLMIAPESGNMLGGTIVNITGPCFKPNDIIRCKFDINDEITGHYVDQNRAICVQPRMYVEGYVNLEVAIGNGKFKWKTKYFVETPGSAAEKIFIDEAVVNEKNPQSIKLTWVKQNLTNNDGAQVMISLWGYRERTKMPEFMYIDSIDTTSNNGEYTIAPGNFRQRDNGNFTDIKFGFLQINLTESIPIKDGGGSSEVKITPVIWSRPIPLGWYFAPQWEREHGPNWPNKLCDLWIKNDRYMKNFAQELPQCPCTLEHALNDKGRFLPDFNCDKDTNRRCSYNKGAQHCVRSGAPTLEGAEQQCCYDKNNYLMLSYDEQWGSSPFRSHNLGYLPWKEANKVPTLSQWMHDIVPKYVCCMWQDNRMTGESGEQSVGCETLRFERRPTQDCVAYQPPEVAGVFGDPHIVTFDNLEYTFNGLGEFVLVKSESRDRRLEVQGRFEKMPMNAYGEVRATQLTAIAARGNGTTVIEVRSRPEYARWRYHLDVLADGKRIYFDRPSLKFQHFPGVLVYTPMYTLNQSEVIMMFDSGAGVEVVENRGYLTARVYLPWTFINQTTGLFGNWSFDHTDDLVDPDGNRIGVNTNTNDFESLYKDFGQKWMLEDKNNPKVGKSLFYREHGKTSSSYNNRTFIPEFQMDINVLIPENRSLERRKAEEYCNEYYQCRYDYAMTLDRDLAHFSLNYHSSIKNIKEKNHEHFISCGILETPRFGRKSNFLFHPGAKVTFECNENFILIGDARRECMSDGQWNLPENGYTECLRYQEYSSRAAGLTTAIVLTVIVLIIVILAYIGYKVIQKRKAQDAEDDGHVDEFTRADEMSRSNTRASPPDDFYNESSSPSVTKSDLQRNSSVSPSKETDID